MATTVYEVKELLLDDGTTITCKPAVIAVNRKGHEMLAHLDEVADNDEGIKKLLDIVCLCLKRQRPEFEVEVDATDDKGEVIKNDKGKATKVKQTNYELMENIFDLETMFKVIEIYLGVKLNDPNLIEAAAKMALIHAEQESVGVS
jgi:hypothetical protein